MEQKPIKILPYDKVQFKFISNHYDIHLNGSCIYENSICEFKVITPITMKIKTNGKNNLSEYTN